MKAKLKRYRHAYREGKIGCEEVGRSVRSYMAHLDQGDCWRLGQNLMEHLVLSRSKAAGRREVSDA